MSRRWNVCSDDHMNVLNMSIGDAFNNWPGTPTAVASDNLVDQGVVVVASIGNSGAVGVWSTGAPGVGNNVIGVASYDNTHISALTFRTNPANTQIAYLQIADTTTAPTSGTTPEVVYIGRGCPQSGPTWTLPQADPYWEISGRSLSSIAASAHLTAGQRAIDAGAVAVVIANNVGNLLGGFVIDRGFPAVGIVGGRQHAEGGLGSGRSPSLGRQSGERRIRRAAHLKLQLLRSRGKLDPDGHRLPGGLSLHVSA